MRASSRARVSSTSVPTMISIADGAVALPEGAQALESFGQQARAKAVVR